MIGNPKVVRALQATASTLVIVVAWQVASGFFPHYLFPEKCFVISVAKNFLMCVRLASGSKRGRISQGSPKSQR